MKINDPGKLNGEDATWSDAETEIQTETEKAPMQ